MIITLMAMAVVMGLSTTVAVVTINNLQSSRSAQQAGAALNAADAGVAQGMSYLRRSGVRPLRCSPTCATNTWGNSATPTAITLGGVGGQAYKAWIDPVRPYPANDPGLYRIHSTGTAAGGATRSVSADVSVSTDLLKGVFARSVNGGGSATVARESIFSTGCVFQRADIHMVSGQMDVAYGIPIAVHTSQVITDSNGSGQFCPTTNKPIHDPAIAAPERNCSTVNPYDQDLFGGSLATTACASAATAYPNYYGSRDLDGDGSIDVNGSFVKDEASLLRLFKIRTPAFSTDKLDQLKSVAISQGNYWTKASPTNSAWKTPDEESAVMFFDLTLNDPGATVDLNEIIGFGRASDVPEGSAQCSDKSLVIVIVGGNAKLNSNQQLFASLILPSAAPNGQVVKANGTSSFVGTIYADSLNLVGNTDMSLDTCFLANLSPALLELHVSGYSEQDR